MVVKGISKLHSLQLRGDEVVPRRFPCFQCHGGAICDECAAAVGIRGIVDVEPPAIDVSLPPVFNEEEGDNSDNEDDEDDDEDDDEENDDVETEEDEAVIIWAPFG